MRISVAFDDATDCPLSPRRARRLEGQLSACRAAAKSCQAYERDSEHDGEISPQGLLTATALAAREAARTLRVGTTSSGALRADAGY